MERLYRFFISKLRQPDPQQMLLNGIGDASNVFYITIELELLLRGYGYSNTAVSERCCYSSHSLIEYLWQLLEPVTQLDDVLQNEAKSTSFKMGPLVSKEQGIDFLPCLIDSDFVISCAPSLAGIVNLIEESSQLMVMRINNKVSLLHCNKHYIVILLTRTSQTIRPLDNRHLTLRKSHP